MTRNTDPARFWELARGFFPSRIFLTAVELKLFGAVGEGDSTSAEVAERLGADPRATDRLMNALVALEVLAKKDGRFSNSADAREFLVSGKPGYVGDALMHAANLWDSWSMLTEAVKAGTSVVKREGKARAGWVKPFISAMHANASMQAPRIAPLVDLKDVKRLLDVGGGSGAYSIEFCRRKPDLNAVVFDLPDVLPLTGEYVAEAGLSDRISTVGGDFSVDELGADFDLAFVSAIIHMNSPEENLDLYRKCWRALRPGGRIVVQDFIVNEDRTTPPQAAIFALNMLVGTRAGDTYTEGEVREALEQAGFGDVKRKDTPGGTTLISAGKSNVV